MKKSKARLFRPILIVAVSFFPVVTSAIQFRPTTIEKDLADAQYIQHVVITDYVDGFRPYEIDGIELITMHRYRIDTIAASPTAPHHSEICTNAGLPVGTELVLTRGEVQVAEEKSMLGMEEESKRLVIENCGSLSNYYESGLSLEIKKVVVEYIDDKSGKFMELSTDTFKASENCQTCFTKKTLTYDINGNQTGYPDERLYVPLMKIDKFLAR